MRKKSVALLTVILVSALVLPIFGRAANSSSTRSIPPIVSTNWLYENLGLAELVVLDIRSPELYNAGHIPGAINFPDGLWYANPPFGADAPWMEMPSSDYLFELLGNASITSDSYVVVVGSTSGPLAPLPLALYATATITRVAITLLYAGVKNVAILDGGHDKWVADGYPTETTPNIPTPITYTGTVKSEMLVSKGYVASKIGYSTIVDARDLEVYLGFIQEPWTARVGHIPTARSFPTPWLWNLNLNVTGTEAIYATYKNVDLLEMLAYYIVGTNKSEEIIVYCGVGGYASTMYFVLSEVLNYTNVKVYDGSAQEWTGDLQLPVVYEGLGSEFMELQGNYTDLLSDYNSLSSSYNVLQSNYTNLLNNYNILQGNYTDLLNKYNTLQSNHNALSSAYDTLQNNYNKLLQDYDELSKSTTPAYLTCAFVVTTIVFLVAAVYLGLKLKEKKG
ncbi:MAG: sulfurtransferase [Candidatus Bathyarchaeia archaeon]